ncbi:MAG: hypothetical protein Ct9H300mP1_25560 [Planctomycetaceae bacterium]|nr:MAG: hypothetical protein Ct9H300mP1_25560 [Planctomycetaceae bacterium]
MVYDDGSQIRCFAHVHEVVNSILGLMDEPGAAGSVFNIGSDQPVSIRQLAERVVAKMGGEIPIEHIAYSEAYGEDFEDIQRRVPEVDKLERAIGSKPKMTLDEILDDIIAWRRAGRSEEMRGRSPGAGLTGEVGVVGVDDSRLMELAADPPERLLPVLDRASAMAPLVVLMAVSPD